ncbi:MAG: hypothetical protein H8E34_09985 [Bacteroidetes bacterium]|nr:hypothetical protein [Bacteroidota bacterium]MBL6942732.1 hypothetical protein [Bacteroidales bacterium]
MAQHYTDVVFAKRVIKTYPLNYFAGGEINLGYEQVVNNKESFEIILIIYIKRMKISGIQ